MFDRQNAELNHFKLSNDMVLVKEKISNIEDKVSKFKPNKRNMRNKKNN